MNTTGAVRVALLAVLWGSTFLWIKVSLEHGLTPVQVVVVRCALGAAVLAVLARRAGQRFPCGGVWRHIVVAALLCNALPFALFAFGEKTVDSSVAGVVHSTTPLWSVAIGLALGTDRGMAPVRRAGLGVGFLGTVLIFAPWHGSGLVSWGALAVLGAAASYAVAFAYMGRHLTGLPEGAYAISAAQLASAMVLAALALPFGGFALGAVDATGAGAVLVLGTLATGVTFYLNYRIIADEGATAAATVGYLLPVVAVMLGAVFLGERVDTRILIGMAVVLAGVALTRARRVRAPARAARTSA